jgi:hypothetical protein
MRKGVNSSSLSGAWEKGKNPAQQTLELYHKFFSYDEFHLETKPQEGTAQSSDFFSSSNHRKRRDACSSFPQSGIAFRISSKRGRCNAS